MQVWDDKYLGNSDFAYIYPFFTLEEINAMEVKFVKLLQYQVLHTCIIYMNSYVCCVE
jgi:hypothetical protein